MKLDANTGLVKSFLLYPMLIFAKSQQVKVMNNACKCPFLHNESIRVWEKSVRKPPRAAQPVSGGTMEV